MQYTGLGHLFITLGVPVMLACGLLSHSLGAQLWANDWITPSAIGAGVAGVAVTVAGLLLNHVYAPPKRRPTDRRPHTVFSIPLEYWGPVWWVVAGLWYLDHWNKTRGG